MTWHPIETAPRDGTWIILAGHIPPDWADPDYDSARNEYGGPDVPQMSIARWSTNKWRDQWDDFYGPDSPAFWTPLPAPPLADRVEGVG